MAAAAGPSATTMRRSGLTLAAPTVTLSARALVDRVKPELAKGGQAAPWPTLEALSEAHQADGSSCVFAAAKVRSPATAVTMQDVLAAPESDVELVVLDGKGTCNGRPCTFVLGMMTGEVRLASGCFTFAWGLPSGPCAVALPSSVLLGLASGRPEHGQGIAEEVFVDGTRIIGTRTAAGSWLGPVLCQLHDGSAEYVVYAATSDGASREMVRRTLSHEQASAIAARMRPLTLPGAHLADVAGQVPGMHAGDLAAASPPAGRPTHIDVPPAGDATPAPGALSATPAGVATAPTEARRARAAMEVRRLLSSVTVDHLGGGSTGGGKVVTVELDASVEDALAVLTEHSVLSCPVTDASGATASGKGSYVAVVHIADIFAAMVEVLAKHGDDAAPSPADPAATGADPHPAGPSPLVETTAAPPQDAAFPSGASAGARRSPLSSHTRRIVDPDVPADVDGVAPAAHGRTRTRRTSGSGQGLRAALAHKRQLMRLSVRDVLGMAMEAEATRASASAGGASSAGSAIGTLPAATATPTRPASFRLPRSLEEAGADASAPSSVGSEADGDSPTASPRPAEISRTAFRQLPAGCPAVYAAHVLAAGAHAVPVVDADGNLVRVVTQADIIRFLASGLDTLPTTRTLTLSDLGLDTAGAERLVVARFDERAIDVFRRMRRAGSSAVPVLDRYGSMSANLSMTDAKAVAKHASIGLLRLPLHAFFREIASARDIRSPSIYCRGADPLHRCIMTLAATRIHQVYFVDATVRPTGVLRVSDVLRVLLGEEP